MTTTTIHTTASRPEVERFLRSIPSVLAGRGVDRYGIARGMRARVGFTILSLVKIDFEDKGRGRTGSDGEKWKPLSKSYLAYQRPVTGRKPPKAGKHAPGGRDGYMTKSELKQWRAIYAQSLAKFAVDMNLDAAKRKAAAIAWKVMKSKGVKTKLGTFGNRQIGVDYQAGVDTGTLRNSLTPGQLAENGPDANYSPSDTDQVYREDTASVVVGTSVPYAGAFHKLRPLWPNEFPEDWWDQILGSIASGIVRIEELFRGGRL